MHTAYPQHFFCNVPPQEHYVTGLPPTMMAPYPAAVDYGISPAIVPDMGQQPQFPVFVKVGDNLLLAHQPNNPLLSHFAPGMHPQQYVTMQPAVMPPPLPAYAPPAKTNGDPLCYAVSDQMQGRHLAMAEVNQMLPPVEAARSILVPRRRSGQRNAAAQRPGPNSVPNQERMLRGNNVAARRRSQSFEGNDSANLSTPSPIKKTATNTGDVTAGGSLAPPVGGVRERSAPDPRTLQKISDVLEYYFSDDCLSKNAYLLKQISMEENGYVSLRRIAALKRMKSLTRDIRVVAYCARQSRKLEMNDDETLIRRVQPLPDNMEAPRFIRTVIAINLPLSNPTIESVTSLFGSFGDLTQVRVLKPGKSLPSYLKDYTAWVPDLGKNPCALVEFESQDEAQRACREINMNHRKFNTLRVALLKPGARLRRTLYRKYKDDELEKGDLPCSSMSPAAGQQIPSDELNQIVMSPNQDQTGDYDASGSGSDSDAEPKCYTGAVRAVSDSGFSQSSGDEQCKSRKNTRDFQKRSTRAAAAHCDVDSSDNSEVASPVVYRTRKMGRAPATNGVMRHPIGPRDNLTRGFAVGFRRCLRQSSA